MTKRTKYFVTGSVGFLALGLTVGLAAYFGGVPGFAEPAGPSELSYVPSDAAVVAYANVKDLMASQFRQQMKGLEPSSQEQGQAELKDAVGIDVERDIDYVVACMLASPTATATTAKNGYVLAHGTFDRPRIEAFVREKGGIERPYKGRTMFVHPTGEAQPAPDGTVDEMGITFVDANVVALGTPAALEKVIDLQLGSASTVRDNGDLMKLIEGVDSGNAWVVGRFDVISKQAHLPAEVQGQLPQLTWFSATGHVNGGVSGTVTAEARDEAAAQNLRQVILGFIALAKMQAGSNPQLSAVAQSVTVNADPGTTVSVSFSVPASVLDLMAKTAAQKAGPVAGQAAGEKPHQPK
jgi:hypothetical protein